MICVTNYRGHLKMEHREKKGGDTDLVEVNGQ